MRGKPENEVLNTTIHRRHLYFFFICTATKPTIKSTFIVVILVDMTSQMLYCTLPIASIVSNKQVMQVSL